MSFEADGFQKIPIKSHETKFISSRVPFCQNICNWISFVINLFFKYEEEDKKKQYLKQFWKMSNISEVFGWVFFINIYVLFTYNKILLAKWNQIRERTIGSLI